MIHPYEFSPVHRSLYVKASQVIQSVIAWAWVAVIGLWSFLVGYLVLQFIRNNWTKANRKPTGQWFSEKLNENQETLHILLLCTLAVIAAVYFLAACHKALKYSRGAWIDAAGNLLIASGLIFFTLQYQQGMLSLSRFAIMAIATLVVPTIFFSIVQGIRCSAGKTLAEQIMVQARPFYETREWKQSKDLLEQALRNNPYHVEALYLLGEICQNEQQPQQSLLIFNLAYEIGKMQALTDPAIQTIMQTIRQRIQSIKHEEIAKAS